MDYEKEDKDWARRYILDPLTAPEPSQEDGPGSSFYNPRRSLSLNYRSNPREVIVDRPRKKHNGYPTPPQSASPSRSSFHHSNPFASGNDYSNESSSPPQSSWAPASAILGRSHSLNTRGQTLVLRTPQRLRSLDRRGDRDRGRDIDRDRARSRDRVSEWDSTRERWPPSPPSAYPPRARAGRKPPQTHHTQGFADSLGSAGVWRSNSMTSATGVQRSSSLNRRYPGDMSHRPLDMIMQDSRAADRIPHRRRNQPFTDTIDSLDQTPVGGSYHHGGPYDATLSAANTNKMYSPVEAVKHSNMEALRATPREYIQDSLTKHVPLQGTAIIPPGMGDMLGRRMSYEEGADLMREPDAPGGPYKRWDGIVSYDHTPYYPTNVSRYKERSVPDWENVQSYLLDDLKGKGEPSFTLEREMKSQEAKQKKHRASPSNGHAPAYEMQPLNSNSTTEHDMQWREPRGPPVPPKDDKVKARQRSVSSAAGAAPWSGPGGPAGSAKPARSPTLQPAAAASGSATTSTASGLRRNNTTGKRIADGLRRRFGSLRWKKSSEDA